MADLTLHPFGERRRITLGDLFRIEAIYCPKPPQPPAPTVIVTVIGALDDEAARALEAQIAEARRRSDGG